MPKPHIPEQLEHAVNQAAKAMHEHPRHELVPYYRAAIYRAVASLGDPVAYLVRGRLAVSPAKHVLPIWQKDLPADTWPERLLARAERVLKGEVSREIGREEADEEFDNAASEYERLAAEGLTLRGHCVLIAAVEALFEASGEYQFWEEAEYNTVEQTDADLDSTTTDAAGWAWGAYAGPFWDKTFDPEKSKEFWEWLLSEAVAEAWQYGNSMEKKDATK